MCRKGVEPAKSITGLHLGEAWGLEKQATVKPERFYIFHPFDSALDRRDWMQWARAWSFEGPCILILSEGI